MITLELPRLRERRQDISGLANYFLQYYGTKYGRQVPALSAALLDRLQDHNWPGNIRELENQVANYVILGPDAFNLARRTASLAPFATASEHGTFLRKVARQASRDAQREMILRVLEETGGNRKLTAGL